MINIPLPFAAMWFIMLLGVISHILFQINKINHSTSDEIPWRVVVKKFFNKEWASYGISIIFTGVMAFSLVYMKRFEHVDNKEISYWAKWIPLAVIILYAFGVLNQWAFYKLLGRIQNNKGKVDIGLLTEEKKE